MRIAVITCYHDPDYVRARTLRAALKKLPNVQVVVIKNTHRGIRRYPEVLWGLRKTLKTQKIDACMLTFRGQEILPYVLWLAGKRPVIFDELIVPIAYANNEQHKKTMQKRIYYFMARNSEVLYRRWLDRCKFILADTQAHAEMSARMSHVNLSKYMVIPIGTDESLFKSAESNTKPGTFRVFYYSSGMQPLHGIDTVLEAAVMLGKNDAIEFLIVGGGKQLQKQVKNAANEGAHITYQSWIAFDELPATMHASGINLGGPFGDTPQAQHVITTKTYQILAAGEPVIVGSSEASDEFFVDKQNALVVPQADPQAIAKAILWAYAHPKELKAIAVSGQKLYDKQFSIEAIAEKLQPIVDAIS